MQLKHLIILLFPLSLISCRSLTSSVMFETSNNYNFDSIEKKQNAIIISPDDQLKVIMTTNDGHILLEQTFSVDRNTTALNENRTTEITYMVGADSLVKLPTVGRVKLGGLTILEAEKYLEELFSKNYQK